ncbi:hypothetical protein [Sphingopyxis sp.]|uniref:hypothetical protein n=1 Tax=Sphingopyxis sp. TaxID=1908224 RepID=UPI003D0D8E30
MPRALRWLLLAFAGVAGGALLGHLAVGGWRLEQASASASFSGLSANPDAAAAPTDSTVPCLDCPDSYGVEARLRAHRENRMSDEFRELGTVDSDLPAPPDPIDDYRYGGRFSDPEPRPIRSERGTDATAPITELAPPTGEAPLPGE